MPRKFKAEIESYAEDLFSKNAWLAKIHQQSLSSV